MFVLYEPDSSVHPGPLASDQACRVYHFLTCSKFDLSCRDVYESIPVRTRLDLFGLHRQQFAVDKLFRCSFRLKTAIRDPYLNQPQQQQFCKIPLRRFLLPKGLKFLHQIQLFNRIHLIYGPIFDVFQFKLKTIIPAYSKSSMIYKV